MSYKWRGTQNTVWNTTLFVSGKFVDKTEIIVSKPTVFYIFLLITTNLIASK